MSRDGTVQLVAVPMSTLVHGSRDRDQAVGWLGGTRKPSRCSRPRPGVGVLWSGDAVLGRDYMAGVQTSLDRAAMLTVVLLLLGRPAGGLPIDLARPGPALAMIGLSLVISRRVLLAWMSQGGVEDLAPGGALPDRRSCSGPGPTSACSSSWRFGEHFNPSNPAGAMRVTLRRSIVALLTSAGTVIVGLSLMGTTRFKLFSSTGPSVAIGLALTLIATLTLTPALLVLLASWRPRCSRVHRGQSSTGLWGRLRPPRRCRGRSWGWCIAAFLIVVPLAALSLRTRFVQDLITELPGPTLSARSMRLIAAKFDPGTVAPLTVVLESDADLRGSEGLALIDDVSRFLGRQRRLVEVRSATQPLGSPATLATRLSPLDSARSTKDSPGWPPGPDSSSSRLSGAPPKLRAAAGWSSGRELASPQTACLERPVPCQRPGGCQARADQACPRLQAGRGRRRRHAPDRPAG